MFTNLKTSKTVHKNNLNNKNEKDVNILKKPINRLGSLSAKHSFKHSINYNINVNNTNQNDIINILNFANDIYQKDEHMEKDLVTKKVNINDLSKSDKAYFSPSSNSKKKLIIQFNSGDKIRKSNNEEDTKKVTNKMWKSSKIIPKNSKEKMNFSNFLNLKQNYLNENIAFNNNSKDKNDEINLNKLNGKNIINAGDFTTKTSKNLNYNFNKPKPKSIKKMKTRTKKCDKRNSKNKQKNSFKSIKSINKIDNQGQVKIIKEKEEVPNNDDCKNNKNNKNIKKNFLEFWQFLCCWNSRINDSGD